MVDSSRFARRQRRLAALTIACVLATFVLPTGAFAASSSDDDVAIDPLQNATSKIVAQAGGATMTHKVFVGSLQDVDAITTSEHAPIPTTTFEIKDPQTGTKVSGDTQIVTPSGKKARAADYWDFVNKAERLLNKRGQSLRDKDASGQPKKRFDLGHFKGGTDADLKGSYKSSQEAGPATLAADGLGSTSDAIGLLPATLRPGILPDDVPAGATLFKPTPSPTPKPKVSPSPVFQTPTPTTTPSRPPVADEQYGYKSMNRPPLNPLPAEQDTASLASFNETKNWTDSVGNPSSADVFLAATSTVQALGTSPMISGELAFGATIVNDRADLGTATATISSRNASFAIAVVGNTVYSLPSTALPISGHPEDVIPFFSFNFPIQLTICVVNIGASMTGSVGLKYSVGPTQPKSGGTALTASFVPDLTVNATYSATVGVGIADIASLNVGVAGSLLVVGLNLPVVASAQFDLVTYRSGTDQSSLRSIYACQAQFKYGLKMDLNATFLSGHLNLVITACFIFCDTLFSSQIAQWSGIVKNTELFHLGKSVPFGGLYTDLPQYGYSRKDGTYSKDDSSGVPAACASLAKQLNIDLAQT